MLFKSKIDKSILFIFLFLLLISSYYVVKTIKDLNFLFVFMLLIVITYIVSLLLNTRYILYDDKVIIKSGFSKKIIQTKSIRFVKKSINSSFAPALSKNRITIYYSTDNITQHFVYISPDNQELFLRELLAKNTHIERKEQF